VTWAEDQLARIGDATELELASQRSDGTFSLFTTMWVIRVGSDLYVRSAGGPDRLWYRNALRRQSGRIRAGGVDVPATFTDAAANGPHDAIDAAYHAKYDRYGPAPVSHVTGASAHAVTIGLGSEP